MRTWIGVVGVHTIALSLVLVWTRTCGYASLHF